MNFNSQKDTDADTAVEQSTPRRSSPRGRLREKQINDLRPLLGEIGVRRRDVSEALRRDYAVSSELGSRAQRAAQCLAWCAKHYPKSFVPWVQIFLSIGAGGNGVRTGYSNSSLEVKRLKSSASSIRAALLKHYFCGLTRNKEGDARATTDEEDYATHVMQSKVKKIKYAVEGFSEAAEAYDPTKIKNPTIRKWATKDCGDIMKIVGDVKFMLKLQPPKQG